MHTCHSLSFYFKQEAEVQKQFLWFLRIIGWKVIGIVGFEGYLSQMLVFSFHCLNSANSFENGGGTIQSFQLEKGEDLEALLNFKLLLTKRFNPTQNLVLHL